MNNKQDKRLNKKYNKIDLKDTVHWRYFKSLARTFLSAENVPMVSYNLNSVTCYSCTGYDLQGEHVSYDTNHRLFMLGSK